MSKEARKSSEINSMAPVKWVTREEFEAYFESLESEDRWDHSSFPMATSLWHWGEHRWWAVEGGVLSLIYLVRRFSLAAV